MILVDAVEARLARLEAAVARLQAREVSRHDPRLGAFLQAVYAFSRAACWSADELIADARRAHRRDLLEAVDRIVGDADPARSLGKFCAKHGGVAVAGLQLVRVKARLWSVCVS